MSSAGPNPSKTREFLGNFQTTELLPLSVGFKGGVTFPLRQTPHPGSSQSAPDVHSGRQAGLDKLCLEEAGGGEGADKDASGSPNSPGPLYFQSGCPDTRDCPQLHPRCPPRGTHRISQAVEGHQISAGTTLCLLGCSHAEVAEAA